MHILDVLLGRDKGQPKKGESVSDRREWMSGQPGGNHDASQKRSVRTDTRDGGHQNLHGMGSMGWTGTR